MNDDLLNDSADVVVLDVVGEEGGGGHGLTQGRHTLVYDIHKISKRICLTKVKKNRMRGWKQGDMFWQGRKAKICLILFLTSGFAVLICLWVLVLPNSNN